MGDGVADWQAHGSPARGNCTTGPVRGWRGKKEQIEAEKGRAVRTLDLDGGEGMAVVVGTR